MIDGFAWTERSLSHREMPRLGRMSWRAIVLPSPPGFRVDAMLDGGRSSCMVGVVVSIGDKRVRSMGPYIDERARPSEGSRVETRETEIFKSGGAAE